MALQYSNLDVRKASISLFSTFERQAICKWKKSRVITTFLIWALEVRSWLKRTPRFLTKLLKAKEEEKGKLSMIAENLVPRPVTIPQFYQTFWDIQALMSPMHNAALPGGALHQFWMTTTAGYLWHSNGNWCFASDNVTRWQHIDFKENSSRHWPKGDTMT